FASGVFARSPRRVKWSGIRCSGGRRSGKAATIRPASEMSAVSISRPQAFEYARRMGSREYDARAGASSVLVQVSFMFLSECGECDCRLNAKDNMRFAQTGRGGPLALHSWQDMLDLGWD